MRKGERASRACALLALALCLFKGLLTVSVFSMLRPSLDAGSDAHVAAVAIVRPEVLVRMDRASPLERVKQALAAARVARQAPHAVAQAQAVALPDTLVLKHSPARHFLSAASFAPRGHGAVVLLASELSEEEPQLAMAQASARAPPGLSYASPPPPVVHPRPLTGLLLPWPTAPPVRA